jgi:hypothetical protein
MWNILFAIPLIMHGLANLAGVFAPWVKGALGFLDVPWVFSTQIMLKSWLGRGFSLVWLVSSVCLIAAGIGLIAHAPWWRMAAIIGCSSSLVAILVWLKAVPPGAKVGAVFDAIVLILLLSPLKDRIAGLIK